MRKTLGARLFWGLPYWCGATREHASQLAQPELNFQCFTFGACVWCHVERVDPCVLLLIHIYLRLPRHDILGWCEWSCTGFSRDMMPDCWSDGSFFRIIGILRCFGIFRLVRKKTATDELLEQFFLPANSAPQRVYPLKAHSELSSASSTSTTCSSCQISTFTIGYNPSNKSRFSDSGTWTWYIHLNISRNSWCPFWFMKCCLVLFCGCRPWSLKYMFWNWLTLTSHHGIILVALTKAASEQTKAFSAAAADSCVGPESQTTDAPASPLRRRWYRFFAGFYALRQKHRS